MLPRNETRKRSARCPECGQFFSPQGLNGHLRFHHGQEGETVKTAQKEAVISGGIAERAKTALELVRQLKQVHEERLGLEKKRDDWDEDSVLENAIATLKHAEKELSDELRKASGRDQLPKKKGFLDTLFSSDEDAESESDDDDL